MTVSDDPVPGLAQMRARIVPSGVSTAGPNAAPNAAHAVRERGTSLTLRFVEPRA